jgi:hypothetical protein
MELRDELRDHLEQRLLNIPHRTYLWAYLVFDYLDPELRSNANRKGLKRTKKGIDELIDSLPENVSSAYEEILCKCTDEEMARRSLAIVPGAVRPLTVEEMNVAVNTKSSSKPKSLEDLDLEDEEDFKIALRDWCGLFISIYQNKVSFPHQTAREFLLPRIVPESTLPTQTWQWRASISL